MYSGQTWRSKIAILEREELSYEKYSSTLRERVFLKTRNRSDKKPI